MTIRHEARGGLADGLSSHNESLLAKLNETEKPFRIPERPDLARALLTEMALAVVGVASDFLEVEVRDSEGGWSVLLSAKAFDYYGAIFVRAGDLYEHKAAELAACIDQVAQSILSGRAEHREGYPRDLLGRA